jgi:methyl-accepting chemotaxis protein
VKIKRRISSLPVISGVVFGLGVVLSILIVTAAVHRIDHVGAVDYPFLDGAKAAQTQVQALTEQLQSAVTEGDKAQLEAAAKQADRVRTQIAAITTLPGKADIGQRLTGKFEAYYAAAVGTARLMLGMQQGNVQKSIADMQVALGELTPLLANTVQEAQDNVAAVLRQSSFEVRAVLWVMILVAAVTVVVLTITARRTTEAIWSQLGDEPEAISEVARRLAAGDISASMASSAQTASSTMASMTALQMRFKAVISELNSVVDAAAHGDLSRRVTLQGKEGCYLDIANSVNRWAENSQQALTTVAGSLRAIAQGELPAPSQRRLEGEYGALQGYCDDTVAALRRVVSELAEAVKRAHDGDFSEPINPEGLRGFQVELAGGVNSLIDVTARGLADISSVLAALQAGNLTKRVEGQHEGAFGELAEHADSAVSQLSSLVSRIRESSMAITRASQEISSGERASQSGTAFLDQLAQTVRDNAESAAQANELGRKASSAASSGKDVVTNVVATMEGITAANNQIVAIVHVIDSIAFQTNILALNAAVEAARAGKEGRGFAVVASQVRDLAKRSAESAKEIKNLISKSVEAIESGSQLASRAGKSMDDICEGIKHVTVFVSEMDRATQHTAALMERTSASAAHLQKLADQLLQGVAVFKLGEESSAERQARAA